MSLFKKNYLLWSCLAIKAFSLEASVSNNEAQTFANEKQISEKKFFSTSQLNIWSLDNLAKTLTKEQYPVLALYQIWSNSVTRTKDVGQYKYAHSPLDYLNFYGSCPSEIYQEQFIKLCQLLGIDARRASKYGANSYDFCLKENEWVYLDLDKEQYYVGWDNETPISSENLMDDPLLVLRSKQVKKEAHNWIEAGKTLAAFKIINFQTEESELPSSFLDRKIQEDFESFSNETFTYTYISDALENTNNQILVVHTLNYNLRCRANETVDYHSPLPITAVINNQEKAIILKNLDVIIQPGEKFALNDALFYLEIVSNSSYGSLEVEMICNKNLLAENILPQVSHDSQATISILNQNHEFSYTSPEFMLTADPECVAEKIWWQISLDKEFKEVLFNLEGIKEYESNLTLSQLEETFLNSQQTYYLRVRGSQEEKWSAWSTPFAFSVKRPEPVTLIEFEQLDDNCFELNWEREAENLNGSIEYLIFASNALDFVPSIYYSQQINKISANNSVVLEDNENLIAITTETKIQVGHHYAYYRIIARKDGMLSVPSPIIHIYGTDLVQPRTILQFSDTEKGLIKRTLIPSTYPWTITALPQISPPNRYYQNSLLELHSSILAAVTLKEANELATGYSRPSHVSRDLWKKMQPHFLPENHPWKVKIDRLFATRVTKNYNTLREAGFRGRITSVRKIFAGTHPEITDAFFKIYCDSEVNMKYTEWQKWLDRIRGRNNVLAVIKKHNFEHLFSVPEKWCYPLPETPAAPPRSKYYDPKDFILVCTNQKPYEHFENEKLWQTKITPEILDALYIVLDEAGMWDSMFIFNIPFSKIDGKICFVDTEYSHKWPLRFDKLARYLSSSNRQYWEKLVKNHGPKGYKNPYFKH